MRPKTGVCTHNGCLTYSKLIICFKVINRSRVYRHYIFYTLFSKIYWRWGFHFEPFKCLHHSHMNNTVNSFDVSIVQFILYNCRLFTLRTGIQNMHIRTCKSIELNKTPHVDRNLNARGILTFQWGRFNVANLFIGMFVDICGFSWRYDFNSTVSNCLMTPLVLPDPPPY